jgi:hypothetical protein
MHNTIGSRLLGRAGALVGLGRTVDLDDAADLATWMGWRRLDMDADTVDVHGALILDLKDVRQTTFTLALHRILACRNMRDVKDAFRRIDAMGTVDPEIVERVAASIGMHDAWPMSARHAYDSVRLLAEASEFVAFSRMRSSDLDWIQDVDPAAYNAIQGAFPYASHPVGSLAAISHMQAEIEHGAPLLTPRLDMAVEKVMERIVRYRRRMLIA